MSDDVGPGGAPLPLGGLLGSFTSRRPIDTSEPPTPGRRRDRRPTDAQILALMRDGVLVIPPRYFVGYFLDLLL